MNSEIKHQEDILEKLKRSIVNYQSLKDENDQLVRELESLGVRTLVRPLT